MKGNRRIDATRAVHPVMGHPKPAEAKLQGEDDRRNWRCMLLFWFQDKELRQHRPIWPGSEGQWLDPLGKGGTISAEDGGEAISDWTVLPAALGTLGARYGR